MTVAEATIPTTYTQSLLTRNPVPSDYNIPHPTWRPHQLESLQWAETIKEVGIIQAATGSGKTTFPAGLSTTRRTCSLTRTKSLQQQYSIYNGCILMGKSNYPCIHPDNEEGANCNDCLYNSMSECGMRNECTYVMQRRMAMSHPFPCVNYALWSSNRYFRETPPPEMLVLDECHLASDIALEWAGTMVNNTKRAEFNLPQFPVIRGATRDDIDRALAWLIESRLVLEDEHKRLRNILRIGPDKKLSRRAAGVQNMDYSFCATRDALRECPEAWYIRSGPQVGMHRGNVEPGIDIRPLTARYHFPRLFLGDKWKTMLMSATVGKFETFAEELGIRMDRCMVRRVPSNFPPSTRPVYILDAPKLGHKSKEEDYLRQAQVIAGAISACPSEWPGIIHITRKSEAPLLRSRLVKYGIDESRLWVLPQQDRHKRWLGTKGQTAAWEEWKRVKPNAIMLSWTHWEGFDGLDEKICIVAKTPFPSTPPGSYEAMRQRYSRKFYNQRTAWALQQALGRTRRGRSEDYDTDNEVRGMVAIADGNYEMVKKWMDDDFVESFVS